MNTIKSSKLTLSLIKLMAENLPEGSSLLIKIYLLQKQEDVPQKTISHTNFIDIDEEIIMNIPHTSIRKDTTVIQCTIQLYIVKKMSSEFYGKLQVYVMDLKNYSKKMFAVKTGQGQEGGCLLHMSMNVSSSTICLDNDEKTYISEENTWRNCYSKQDTSSGKQRSQMSWKKSICGKREKKDEKGNQFKMLRANSSIVALRGKKMKASTECPEKLDLLNTSDRVFPKESYFSKEIEHKLQKLNDFKVNDSQANIALKFLKDSETSDQSIFHTFSRMKEKFEKIHEDQALIYSKQTNEQISENLLDPKKKQKEQQVKENIFSFKALPDMPEQEPAEKSEEGEKIEYLQIVNCDTFGKELSHVASGQFKCEKDVDLISSIRSIPGQQNMRICHSFSTKFEGCRNQESTFVEPYLPAQRYKQSLFTGSHEFNRFRLSINPQLQGLSQTQIKGESSEWKPQEQVKFVRMNERKERDRSSNFMASKMDYDLLISQNRLLVKANEELYKDFKKASDKLELSNRVVREKQHMLTTEFQMISQQVNNLVQKLEESSGESKKREQKIKHHQTLQSGYIRQINNLKEKLQQKNISIKSLRSCLAQEEDHISTKDNPKDEDISLGNFDTKSHKSMKQQDQSKREEAQGSFDKYFSKTPKMGPDTSMKIMSARTANNKRETASLSHRQSLTFNQIFQRIDYSSPSESSMKISFPSQVQNSKLMSSQLLSLNSSIDKTKQSNVTTNIGQYRRILSKI